MTDGKTRQKMIWYMNFINTELDRGDEIQDIAFCLTYKQVNM